ncbi:MAG: tetratricopeptide repeat protein [bacterium]|nr:tetratricopeptide repeat protein [bacterium]
MIKTIFTFFLLSTLFAFPCFAARDNTGPTTKDLEKKLETLSGKEKVDVLIELTIKLSGKSPAKVVKYSTRALELAKKLDYKKGVGQALLHLAEGYQHQGNHQKAMDCLPPSIEAFEAAKDKSGLAYVYNNMGINSNHLGQRTQALHYYEKALALFEELGEKRGIARTSGNIGIIYKISGNYPKALEYYFKTLKITEAGGDQRAIAYTYNNIANVYMASDQNKKALPYLQKALKIGKAIDDVRGNSHFINSIGNIHFGSEEFEKALEYFRESLKIRKKIGDKMGIGNALNSIGKTYHALSEPTKALEYSEKSLKIHEEIGSKRGIAESKLIIGLAYTLMKDYDKAEQYLEHTLEIFKNLGLPGLRKDAYGSLSYMYKKKGDYENAFNYHIKYTDTLNELFNEENSERIALLETRFHVEQTDKENLLLKKEKELKEAQINRRTTILIAVAVGFLLLLLSVAISIRDNRTLDGQKKRIQVQNEKLLELSRFREEMTGMIVHDLKNPLNNIINYSDPQTGKSPTEIKQSGKLMLDMVLNILDVQKFENVDMKLKVESQNIYMTAADAAEEVAFLAHNKSLSIQNNIPRNLYAKMDRGIVKRVLVNLLTNAIKHTPDSGIVIIEAALPSPAEQASDNEAKESMVRISVTDTGEGIPDDKLASVFDRFGQVKVRRSGSAASTGIGLTYCKLAVESHGGSISVDSMMGEGTTFAFTLKKGVSSDPDSDGTVRSKKDTLIYDTLKLSEKDWKKIGPFLEELTKTSVHELSPIMDILDRIEVAQGSTLYLWKQEIKNCVFSCNKNKYLSLIGKDSAPA